LGLRINGTPYFFGNQFVFPMFRHWPRIPVDILFPKSPSSLIHIARGLPKISFCPLVFFRL